ncbi:hypothetical protein BpHYR1_045782 [Brachionus plicatilis]|uniref:Uncharacterized protein n=1 Tax=Brachionus plicatilis TaxID=10195 RepID=A0A3M7RDP8_BRAPC|nr:hypothetical protein BpHYR1_045782 [Brachionus plicatilis]
MLYSCMLSWETIKNKIILKIVSVKMVLITTTHLMDRSGTGRRLSVQKCRIALKIKENTLNT